MMSADQFPASLVYSKTKVRCPGCFCYDFVTHPVDVDYKNGGWRCQNTKCYRLMPFRFHEIVPQNCKAFKVGATVVNISELTERCTKGHIVISSGTRGRVEGITLPNTSIFDGRTCGNAFVLASVRWASHNKSVMLVSSERLIVV